jgi:ribosomal protein S18 acetylase RimI-like enzyme
MDSTEPLILRPYRTEDLTKVVAMWHASKRQAFPYVEVQQTYTIEDDTGFFREVIATEYALFLAEAKGQIVGMMAIKAGYIDQLFVAVDAQGQGVGTTLLAKAKELSPTGLRLYTFQKNAKARIFYEKHGFRAVQFGTSPPPENEPDVEYRWTP